MNSLNEGSPTKSIQIEIYCLLSYQSTIYKGNYSNYTQYLNNSII